MERNVMPGSINLVGEEMAEKGKDDETTTHFTLKIIDLITQKVTVNFRCPVLRVKSLDIATLS